MKIFSLMKVCLLILLMHSSWVLADSSILPVDSAVRVRVDFWKKVYTEITASQGFIHDSEDLSVIYETVTHRSKSRRARTRQVRSRKREIKSVLRSIYRKNLTGLTEREAEIMRKIPDPTRVKILEMTRNIRYQRGLKDRYLVGLERSYRYLERIKKIFKEEGVPVELSYLPHVESSFNYKAYSKVGAAGIWQFMRGTARQFGLKMTYAIDERRDPIRTARAAARLLKQNYRRLDSWPLALTAYNHGAASMLRAIRRLKTRDIGRIIEGYEGRRFGFASKNFYATFIATKEISEASEEYFPNHKKESPLIDSEISLDKPLTIREIARVSDVSIDDLKRYNPALRPIVFRSALPIPKNYNLRVPFLPQQKLVALNKALNAIEVDEIPRGIAGEHRVSRGENLSDIARAYRTSVTTLVAINGIDRPSRIYPGMKIKIPSSGRKKVAKFKTKPKSEYASDDKQGSEADEEETKEVAKAETSEVSEPVEEEQATAEPVAVASLTGKESQKINQAAESSEETETEAVTTALEDDTAEVNEADGEFESEEGGEGESVADSEVPVEEDGMEVVGNNLEAGTVEPPVYGPFPLEQKSSDEPKKLVNKVSVDTYDLEIKDRGRRGYQLVVQPEETLGHYADWAGLGTWRIRKFNRLRFGQHIRIGQKLKIPLSKKKLEEFKVKRLEYHLAIQEDFYSAYKVGDVSQYQIRRGDTANRLMSKFKVPLWLLRKEQKSTEPLRLIAGQKILIPKVEPIVSDTKDE